MSVKKEKWYLFQEYIAGAFKEIYPNARSTKASGGSTEKGDICGVDGLHIEAKDYNKKSVYNEDWMLKCISEVPLHADLIPIIITRNKDNNVRVHMDFDDFKDLYIELIKYRRGEV